MDHIAHLQATIDQIKGLQSGRPPLGPAQTPQQFAAAREAELYQEYQRTKEGEAAHIELKQKFEDWCAVRAGRRPNSEITQTIAKQQEEIDRLSEIVNKLQKDFS